MLLGSVIGYIAGRWGDALVTDRHPVPPAFAAAIGTVVLLVGQGLVGFLLVPGTDPVAISPAELVLALAVNTVAMLPVYVAVRSVFAWIVPTTELPRRGVEA
jgi:hypothetical protein